ncbi:MAG TPA: hypothetical protein VFI28_00625 [Candidatus Limnocylindrales bacterium]|nr:hypothetical protein [Candidatus Limnocylindrales bacterium]
MKPGRGATRGAERVATVAVRSVLAATIAGLLVVAAMTPVGLRAASPTASAVGSPAAVPAAVPSASPAPSASPPGAGDTRSSGEGAGFVGQPLLAVGLVVAIGLVATAATLAYVRLTARRP